jgi:hypothetical protein
MKILLFILSALVAITAIVSGLLMISNPDGNIMSLQLSILKNSPFNNFLVPGIVLVLFVGGTNLLAIIYLFQNSPNRYNWAIAGGVMICCWIVVQMILLNALSWLQFVYLGVGLLIILTAYQLKGKWAA